MDKLKLRYLIREAIENVANVTSKFSVGDKVTTVDGDTAVVTMAEHPFYTVELEKTGTNKTFNFKDIAPFQEKEIAKTSEGIKLQEGANASLGLLFHQTHNKPLSECIFRIGSKSYVEFYSEARELFNEGVLKINELDRDLVRKTDIGEYGLFENKEVPLDIPFINESLGGEDTAWEDDKGNKITLQDILDMTKNVPQKDYPTEKLAKIVLNWDDNPEEVERIEQVEISKQYPILIMVDEAGEIQWILDGNHRAQKALRSKSKTIPAKLIKPSNLDSKAKKVLLGVVTENLEEKKKKKKSTKKDPPIGKPKRGGSKAYYVYVRDKGKIKKVSFGSGGLRAKINNPKARKAFAARHNCDKKNDRTKPGYWSCRLPRYAKQLGLGANKNTFW